MCGMSSRKGIPEYKCISKKAFYNTKIIFWNDHYLIQRLNFDIGFPKSKICIMEKSFWNTIFLLRIAHSVMKIFCTLSHCVTESLFHIFFRMKFSDCKRKLTSVVDVAQPWQRSVAHHHRPIHLQPHPTFHTKFLNQNNLTFHKFSNQREKCTNEIHKRKWQRTTLLVTQPRSSTFTMFSRTTIAYPPKSLLFSFKDKRIILSFHNRDRV